MTFVYDYERYKNEPKDYEIVVKADTNDADYVTETSKISLLEIEEIVKPALEIIKANGCSVPWNEHNRKKIPESFKEEEELMDVFREMCPFGEYGIHTIESVVYYPLPKKVELL